MPEIATPVHVDLSPPQRYEYDHLAKDFLSELEVMDDRTYANEFGHVMSRRMRLLRLCSDPGHRSLPSPVFDPSAKWLQIDGLLETILSNPNEKGRCVGLGFATPHYRCGIGIGILTVQRS